MKESTWFSTNQNKRLTEYYFLIFSSVWIIVFGTVVVTEIYKDFNDLEYLLLGCFIAFPYFLIPLFFPFKIDKSIPIYNRYWFKANVWIAIFGFIGNYFWTHYFYKVLGSSYSFPVTIMLNEVPFFLYLITHGYFCFYFTFSTIVLRKFWSTLRIQNMILNFALSAIFIFFLSVFTAFMETFTISNVPYYSHDDKFMMYTIGSVFYAIYFIIGFPMFYRVDEDPKNNFTLFQSAIESFASCMIVFTLLDLWRLFLVPLYSSDLKTGVTFV
eukprot:TRINITY_DN16058_c0_g1_i2.p1 TRINITY_DN16058_c0_g1~~TRINITY_DN16058_c0_g1_i2.p1  ORF type:complete len:280 (+),score=38.39 TRINITY_DN16058_c0_g1_i2:33-842(+)